ncbi:MAG: hypothetical protein AAF468_15675 [Pseudomonadota bacterium]
MSVLDALADLGIQASVSGPAPITEADYLERVTIHEGDRPDWRTVVKKLAEQERVERIEAIREEASRRMRHFLQARDKEHLSQIIINGHREATRLQEIKIEHLADPTNRPELTQSEHQRVEQLKSVDRMLEAIRSASNNIPDDVDFADDQYWPTARNSVPA